MDVGLLVLGALVVDDVGDPGDVNATRSDVGGDEDGGVAAAELLEGLFASDLGEVAMDGPSLEATVVEVVGQTLAGALGTAEDDDLLDIAGLQDAPDDLDLVHRMGLVDELLGIRNGGLGVGTLGTHVYRTVQLGTGQSHDRCRHGGREEHGLARGRGAPDEVLDVGQEAQVKHLVSLVENDDAHVGQVEVLALGEVQKTSGGADDDVDPGLQRVDLWFVADAAIDGEDSRAAHRGGGRDVLGHLEG